MPLRSELEGLGAPRKVLEAADELIKRPWDSALKDYIRSWVVRQWSNNRYGK